VQQPTLFHLCFLVQTAMSWRSLLTTAVVDLTHSEDKLTLIPGYAMENRFQCVHEAQKTVG
jgi:hypothetical protein